MPRRKRTDPKLEALRKHGTLNPKPEDVHDAVFDGDQFFDPRDLLQVKYEMLRQVRCDGQSVAEAARRFGLSRPTFYKAHGEFERDGLAGLLPAKRGPRGPHKLTDKVMGFVADQLAKDSTLSAVALAERIHKRFGRTVHPRTIERALVQKKKTALSRTVSSDDESRPWADAIALSEVYEDLRRDALHIGQQRPACVHGLACVIRKGLAAWMHVWAATSAPVWSRLPAPRPAGDESTVPRGCQEELVHVLATMALSSLSEVRA